MTDHPLAEHIPKLRRYACALLRDRSRADDLVQDTLERALKKFSLFRRGSDLRAWLFTIMHNVYVNQIASSANRHGDAHSSPDEYADSYSTDDVIDAHDLNKALQRLPPDHREVILLVGLEQLSYEQTADVLGVPVGTVMSRLARARERLRTLMSGEAGPQIRRVK
jgi:RNA polymerase sigma-70 factor (ECF subfamily)